MKTFLLGLFFISRALCNDSFICGELVFPARGNIEIEQGTYEVWFQEVNPAAGVYEIGAASNRAICQFLSVVNSDSKSSRKAEESFLRFCIFTDGNRHSIGAGFMSDNSRVGYATKSAKLSPDWNYAAITWEKTSKENYKITSYLNGEEMRSTEQKYSPLKKFERHAKIYITRSASYLGRKNDSGSIGVIDSFRLSKTVRTLPEIKQSFEKGFVEDKQTSLFDDFSKLIPERKYNIVKAAEKPSELSGKTSHKRKSQRGLLYGPYKLVEGRNGTQAVEFFYRK